ncbi:integral membrane protein [Delitschia confertaspora ATCC 74209]|uniref:Integral membrane protein n=1 Tax=Delitschia confertaspora ATCC 74209 TaxID=1513339 RepID=A0A9P4N065_9PLEO|nr:integral membrane protein [Delitschia confertaspora ATCC 74209]
MGVGAFIEPLVVVTLLFGGTWVNRNTSYRLFSKKRPSRPLSPSASHHCSRSSSPDSLGSECSSPRSSASLLSDNQDLTLVQEPQWRKREIRFLGMRTEVLSPNTRRFQGYFLSRVLMKFPFLVEAWYWALIYWVYQLGRAFTALTLVESTVDVARHHALQIIHLEQRLHIFLEPSLQAIFLRHQTLLHWTNRIYSFIHIPGTILFLVWLYYYTTTRNRLDLPLPNKGYGEADGSPAGPKLYAARRRTMAVCNLLAFIVFTLWPCMPPRLLSDPDVEGSIGEESRSYGFVDTVHGAEGESSVWTQNKFCNQYAAMPSLHFGYSLLIGLTICSIPLAPKHRRSRSASARIPFAGTSLRFRCPSPKRMLCLAVGIAYPTVILVAIIATANHFVLDAVAGACVCGIAWTGNRVLLNLLPVEDYFLWCVRIHKPVRKTVGMGEEESEDYWEDNGRLRKGVVVN